MVDFQYFGDMPGITPYEDEARPDDENEELTAKLQRYLDDLFTRDDLPELRADRDQVDRLIARRPDLGELTDQEIVDHARSFLPLYRRLFCRHILVSGASGIGIGTVAGVLAAIEQPELIMTLVAGLGDVDSAAPSWAMWDMSRIVKGSPISRPHSMRVRRGCTSASLASPTREALRPKTSRSCSTASSRGSARAPERMGAAEPHLGHRP